MAVELTRPAAQTRPLITETDLCAWVGAASPGDHLVYHRGLLAFDVGPHSDVLTLAERQQLRLVAARAWKLDQNGLVYLVQRRESEGVYSYAVVCRLRPRRRDAGALQKVLQAAGLASAEPAKAGPARTAGSAKPAQSCRTRIRMRGRPGSS